jgi:hypothetical protein
MISIALEGIASGLNIGLIKVSRVSSLTLIAPEPCQKFTCRRFSHDAVSGDRQAYALLLRIVVKTCIFFMLITVVFNESKR